MVRGGFLFVSGVFVQTAGAEREKKPSWVLSMKDEEQQRSREGAAYTDF